MPVERIIKGNKILITNYGRNYLTTNDIFDLEAEELSMFLRKKKDAPVGNLREIYHSQSNRGLISKIAREMLMLILHEVIDGKTFYLPNSSKEKIFVAVMANSRANFKRSIGRYSDMNLFMTDFKIPELQLFTTQNKRFYNMSLFVNNELAEKITQKVNDNGKVGGKIPIRMRHILPYLYDTFSYIEKDCIKLICNTFFRRLRIISRFGCDLIIKDRHNMVRFFNPVSAEKYDLISYHKKEFVSIKLRQDKIKNFPCQNKPQMDLMS
jgi:hypothetical protein